MKKIGQETTKLAHSFQGAKNTYANTNLLELFVNITSPRKTFFSGKAYSVTSSNDKGEFSILPLHANFISLIKDYIIVDRGTQKEKKFVISKGILKVEKNKVDIFLDI